MRVDRPPRRRVVRIVRPARQFARDRGRRPDGGARGRARMDDRTAGALTAKELEEVAAARVARRSSDRVPAEVTPEAMAAAKEISKSHGQPRFPRPRGDQGRRNEPLNVLAGRREGIARRAHGRKARRLSALQHLVNLLLSRRSASGRESSSTSRIEAGRERQLRDLAIRPPSA